MKVTVKTIDAGDQEFDLPEEVNRVLLLSCKLLPSFE